MDWDVNSEKSTTSVSSCAAGARARPVHVPIARLDNNALMVEFEVIATKESWHLKAVEH